METLTGNAQTHNVYSQCHGEKPRRFKGKENDQQGNDVPDWVVRESLSQEVVFDGDLNR